MLGKGTKKSIAPTPRPKSLSKSKSKSNPKIKTKNPDISKPSSKPPLTKHKPNPLKPKAKSRDLNSTMAIKRETPPRCKSRPKSSLSATFKKQPPPKEKEYYRFNINDLVTEEDMIVISEQNDMETLPTLSKNFMRLGHTRKKVNEEEAATLIQKTWRGYKTRRLVKHYINLYDKIDAHKPFKKEKGGSSAKKKEEKKGTQRESGKGRGNPQQPDTETLRSQYQININMNINISPVQQYSFYSQEQPPSNNQSGVTLGGKVSIKSFPSSDLIESKTIDPMLRVTELQLNLLSSEQCHQLEMLDAKLLEKRMAKEVYSLKKKKVIDYYQGQREKLKKSRSQLSFGFLKVPFSVVYPNSREIKPKASHSEDKLLMNKMKSIVNTGPEEQEERSLDLRYSYLEEQRVEGERMEDSEGSSVRGDVMKVQKPLKPFISSFLQDDLEQINTEDIQNMSLQSLQIQVSRQYIDHIQSVVENRVLDELVLELYLTPSIGKQLNPFFDLTQISKFNRITQDQISQFIDMMFSKFRPSEEDLLKRLNQKINPTAQELLKILRNDEGDVADEFYELVIPEKNFKDFREWKDKEVTPPKPLSFKAKRHDVSINQLEMGKLALFQIKEKEYMDKKVRLLKFQKDLQAMYLKSVFNCLNEAIVETKCSYSPINGRSTISPGELQVSLFSSNTEVSQDQVPSILVKSKDTVMRNFKYVCPNLNISNYESVYKFQQILMKQLHQELEQSEHKWVSFFDEHLEIGMEVYSVVLDQLILEATREMYWKVWKR